MTRGLFITGTGTSVGKTYIAALMARSLLSAGRKVGVYKPVASGCELREGNLVSPDAVALWQAAGQAGTLEKVCPQRFAAPLAPHRAAWAENRDVDSQLLRAGIEYWRRECDILLVEGAGGLMSPVTVDEYNADLAHDFGYPLVIVTANALGTINATLQTLLAAEKYDLSVAGIVLNSMPLPHDDPSTQSNADELRKRCSRPVLAEVTHGAGFGHDADWWALADNT